MASSDLADIMQAIPQGAEAAFPEEEYARRIAALRERMGARGLDLAIITGPENIFYLSGQQTPAYSAFQAMCIPASGALFLVIRGLETMNARLKSRLEDIVGYADDVSPPAALAQALKARGYGGKRIGVDRNAWFLTVNIHERLAAEIGPLEDASDLVEPLRAVKSPLELAEIEKAGRANDAGMAAGLAAVRAGVSENHVAAAIMAAAIEAGSEYVGMEPFVTSGPRSGIPHTTWRRRVIQPGDIVALETCACYNRYHAALFRTVAVGKVPDLALEMYKVCAEGLEAALDRLRPGNSCADVHNAAQTVIDRAGYTEGFRKRAGYSVGIAFAPDWGEGHVLSLFRGVDVPLQPGMVFHVPITLRAYNQFTVAVSETVQVTEGAPRVFGSIGRDIIHV